MNTSFAALATQVRSFATRLRGAPGGSGGGGNSARASAILGGTPGSVRSTPGSVGPSPGGSGYGGSWARYTPASPRPDDPSSGNAGSSGSIGADGKFQMALPQRGGGMQGGPGGGRGPGGAGQFSGRSFHAQAHSQYVGKVVRVTKGPYNGYRGRVKQQTATHVQVRCGSARHLAAKVYAVCSPACALQLARPGPCTCTTPAGLVA